MSSKRMSLDDASRLLSEALTTVFHALEADQSVSGVAVFHTGSHYVVDMNFLSPGKQGAWSLSLQLADTVEEATRAGKNTCAKTVKPEQAYEVWQVDDHPEYSGTWTWYVLKKYQIPEKEAANPYARWFCFVTSPYTKRGDWGDTYVTTITSIARKLNYNPLCSADNQTTGKEE